MIFIAQFIQLKIVYLVVFVEMDFSQPLHVCLSNNADLTLDLSHLNTHQKVEHSKALTHTLT